MCPSFRVTGNERDVTRGRANSLRLAISGQLGPDAFASDEMLETMKLCVSCKGCRRECPTGVDMAKMKIEVLAAANRRRGLSLRDRLVAYLPRYAPYAARLAPLMNARNAIPGLAALTRAPDGLLRQAPAAALAPRCLSTGRQGARTLPSPLAGRGRGEGQPKDTPRELTLTPNPSPQGEGDSASPRARGRAVRRYVQHLLRAGEPARRGRGADARSAIASPCCAPAATTHGGRVRCAAGARSCPRVWSRRRAARRAACWPRPRRWSSAACPSSAWSPPACSPCATSSCPAAGPADRAARSAGLPAGGIPRQRERPPGASAEPIARRDGKVLLHGHCHQKAFGAMGAVSSALALVEGLSVETVESSCCGMAGAFGYGADTYDVSMAMGELSPAAGRAPGRAGHPDRRRRLLLPPPDPRRHRTDGAACRAHPARTPWARTLMPRRASPADRRLGVQVLDPACAGSADSLARGRRSSGKVSAAHARTTSQTVALRDPGN